MRAARIYRPAELIGGKINHLQVQACHGPAKGCLLGWGQRRHTRATQPRLGRACGRGDRGELRRSPRICPEQEGRYLGRRPAVKPLPCPSHRGCRTAWPDLSDRWFSRLVATASANRLRFRRQSAHVFFLRQPAIAEQSRLMSTPLSRSSTAHVLAHVSVQGRCTCPWICRTCSRQRRAYSERLDIGETLHRRAARQGRGSLRRSRLESRSGIEISDNPLGIRDGAICR